MPDGYSGVQRNAVQLGEPHLLVSSKPSCARVAAAALDEFLVGREHRREQPSAKRFGARVVSQFLLADPEQLVHAPAGQAELRLGLIGALPLALVCLLRLFLLAVNQHSAHQGPGGQEQEHNRAGYDNTLMPTVDGKLVS